jgi:hypothetical protein
MQLWAAITLLRRHKMRYIRDLAGIGASAPTPYDIEAESPDHPWPANGGPKATHLGRGGESPPLCGVAHMREPVS